jgi:hypothetical protein
MERKSNADVTQVVAPLPPPVAPRARVVRDRPPSPRVIAELAAEPTTAHAPTAYAPTAEAPADASTLAKPGNPWAEIKNGKVTYHFVGMPERDVPKVTNHREARSAPAGAPGKVVPARRIRLRTAVIAAATLVAAILVVAIGFSSDELPRARAATELDRALLPDPRPSPTPARELATAAPATTPRPAAEPAQNAQEPAGGAAGATRRPSIASSPEEPRSAAATPPAPHPRPRSPATSSSRTPTTRESGHAKPAGHARARSARPFTYDPDALFLDKR